MLDGMMDDNATVKYVFSLLFMLSQELMIELMSPVSSSP